MATFSAEMPPQLTGNDRQDVAQLRQYLARLVDRLLYTLNHLDSENLVENGIGVRYIQGGGAGILEAAVAELGEAKIGKAAVQHLNAQVAEIVTAVIQTAVIDWASIARLEAAYAKVGDLEVEKARINDLQATKAYVSSLTAKYANVQALEAEIARIADAQIAQAEIGTANIQNLQAYCANIVNAEIQTATIDWAQISHIEGNTAIVARFLGDRMYIDRLAVNSAQMMEMTVAHLVLKASDGKYYQLDIDPESGEITHHEVTVTEGEITAGLTSSGRTILETDLLVTELNAQNATAMEALIQKLTASRIDVDKLFAREAVLPYIQGAVIEGQFLQLKVNEYTNGLRTDVNGLKEFKQSTELALQPGQIMAKVKQTEDWTDTQKALEDLESEASGNAGDISSLQSRMQSAEQKITPAAIVSTVTQSEEWNASVGDLQTRMQEAEQKITPESIVSRVQSTQVFKTAVEDAVSDLVGYRVEITSTSDVLSDTIRSTTLTARVWHGSQNVTDGFPASRFQWRRRSADSTADELWANQHKGIKSITLTPADVTYSATYECELLQAEEG